MTRKFQIAALSLVAAVSACGSAAQGIYTKSQERLPYRFFRVEADFEVKATGERIEFDYIAWCGGSVTHWRAGSPSIRYDLFPQMMHMPTQDGAAIGIRTFNMCEPWTWENDGEGNSRIPDDLLPVVQWYPDVNDMGFAIGYESDAAYASPYSKLNFLGAKLSQTDAGTWSAWRKDYEAGFNPVGDIENPYYDINTPSRIRRVCNSASRVAIPPERMQEAEGLMPVGTGRFWLGATSRMTEARKQSAEAFEKLLYLDAWRYGRHFQGQNLSAFRKGGYWLGAITRSGGGRVKFINTDAGLNLAYSDVFPVIMELSEAPDKKNGTQGKVDLRIATSEHWNGFSFCGMQFVPEERLQAYLNNELAGSDLNPTSVDEYEWREDGDPATDGAWVRRQTVFRTFIGDELVVNDGLPWDWTFFVYDRNGFMYLLEDH